MGGTGAAGRGTHAVGTDGQAVGHGTCRRACNTHEALRNGAEKQCSYATGSGAANKAKPNKNIVCINERHGFSPDDDERASGTGQGGSDTPSWQQMSVNVAGIDGDSEHEVREGAGGAEALIPAAYLSA
ncbi:hypothetical protein GGX14DRAFT_408865 [Mycena pura]|uniref:Uncharacterized protein n=1 Tax=Mycena pura TaxID=153505 RepID=A0AAD6US59_9AGAR|nr:hypothetical protein GGX14DRAFT_408865 [Mycena pura]